MLRAMSTEACRGNMMCARTLKDDTKGALANLPPDPVVNTDNIGSGRRMRVGRHDC